jgi:hypothetical protein
VEESFTMNDEFLNHEMTHFSRVHSTPRSDNGYSLQMKRTLEEDIPEPPEALIPDIYEAISRHLSVPAHYYALARVNKTYWLRLAKNPRIHGPMRREYFAAWHRLLVKEQPTTALIYTPKQTPELCRAAVKKYGQALQYVRCPTLELELMAVSQAGCALEYVRERTDALVDIALTNDHWVWTKIDVAKKTPEFTLHAISLNPKVLRWIKDQIEEMCLCAVRQNGFLLAAAKVRTRRVLLEAVRQNGRALQYVTSDEQTDEIYQVARESILLNEKFT